MTVINIGLLLAVLLVSSLTGCDTAAVTITDVVGTYRADVPAGHVALVINGDGTWEYHIDGPSQFRRTGKWTLEVKESARSTVAMTLTEFDFGFPLRGSRPPGPSYQYFYFERPHFGRLRTCIENLGAHWGPKGRLCFEQD